MEKWISSKFIYFDLNTPIKPLNALTYFIALKL